MVTAIELCLLVVFTVVVPNLINSNINTCVTYLSLFTYFVNIYRLIKGGIIMNKSNDLKGVVGVRGVGTH